MDYIKEELLRQKRVLGVLLSPTGEEEETEARRRVMEDREADSEAGGLWREAELAAMEDRAQREWRLGSRAGETEDRLWEAGAEAETLRYRLAGRSAENRRQMGEFPWAGAQRGIGAGDGPQGPEMLRPSTETAGAETTAASLRTAQEVSRTVEREARRYDGGYPLY